MGQAHVQLRRRKQPPNPTASGHNGGRCSVVRHPGEPGLKSELAFSMSFVDGQNLSNISTRGWTLEKKLEVFEEICQAVKFAHDNKIIHRDIKPANIVLDSDDKPVLTDFDLADLQTLRELTARTAGSLVYAAPEQLDPTHDFREYRRLPESDIFSLGRLLFFLLTETEPLAIYREPIPALPELKHIEGLRRVVRRCTLDNPELRYKAIDELLLDLRSSDQVENSERGAPAVFPRHSINDIPPQPIGNPAQSIEIQTHATIWAARIGAKAKIAAAIIVVAGSFGLFTVQWFVSRGRTIPDNPHPAIFPSSENLANVFTNSATERSDASTADVAPASKQPTDCSESAPTFTRSIQIDRTRRRTPARRARLHPLGDVQ